MFLLYAIFAAAWGWMCYRHMNDLLPIQVRALPFRKKKPFATLFPNANPLAVDFLTKSLVRISVCTLAFRMTNPTILPS